MIVMICSILGINNNSNSQNHHRSHTNRTQMPFLSPQLSGFLNDPSLHSGQPNILFQQEIHHIKEATCSQQSVSESSLTERHFYICTANQARRKMCSSRLNQLLNSPNANSTSNLAQYPAGWMRWYLNNRQGCSAISLVLLLCAIICLFSFISIWQYFFFFCHLVNSTKKI